MPEKPVSCQDFTGRTRKIDRKRSILRPAPAIAKRCLQLQIPSRYCGVPLVVKVARLLNSRVVPGSYEIRGFARCGAKHLTETVAAGDAETPPPASNVGAFEIDYVGHGQLLGADRCRVS